jgi:nitrite reductase/ring-hydroxylating ferredoxin subunit
LKSQRTDVEVVRVREAAKLTHGETLAFAFARHGVERAGFVLRFEGALKAFANVCPHWNVDLDLGMGRFYSERLNAIVCRNHGALFEPATGLCRAGPCVGAGLEQFEVSLDGLDALVRIPSIVLIWP